MNNFFKGKGRTSSDPYIEVTERDNLVEDFYGRDVLIPAGSAFRWNQ